MQNTVQPERTGPELNSEQYNGEQDGLRASGGTMEKEALAELITGICPEAMFHSGIEGYRSPEEPKPGEEVKLCFRTGKGCADAVYFRETGGEDRRMLLGSSDTLFDYYCLRLKVGTEEIPYSFEIRKGEQTLFYNRLGVVQSPDHAFDFRIIPGFHVPDWIKGAVMYQIFIDRFCDGDPTNNVETNEYIYLGRSSVRIGNWDAPVEPFDVHRFYGGDLQGVMDKLDYIYGLGVRVIYFNPLFVSPSNHKYDTQDYDHIDPHIGRIVRDGGSLVEPWEDDNARATRYSVRTTTRENLDASDELFRCLVEACHARGMRVIIDGVFNHCGSFNKWMNRSGFYHYRDQSNEYEPGAYERRESPYHDYFSFSRDEEGDWPRNDSYEKWWGNDTLPKLNYEGSRALEEDILRIARKWVSAPYCCDGWRLDVAADLGHSPEYNHHFWKRFRSAVKKANPEAVIIAEHYGDPCSWLGGDEWDTIMNYDAFMEPVTWFLTGMEKHSDMRIEELQGNGRQFFDAVKYHMSRMPESSVLSSMNQLSNHDHSRFMTRTNGVSGRLAALGSAAAEEGIHPALYRLAAMMQFTWPGAPTIYYGDEVGMCGWTEPDSRRPFPWGKEDFELLEYHRYLTQIHRNYEPLKHGAIIELMAGKDYIVYARIWKRQVAVVCINAGSEEFPLQIPVWRAGITDDVRIRRVMKTEENAYNPGVTNRLSTDGRLRAYMHAFSGKIYVADLDAARVH